MNRIAAAAIAAIAFSLVACSSSAERPASTSSAQAPASAASTTTIRRGEISDQDRVLISQLDAYWLATPRADLIQAAEKACTMMRAGQKLDLLATLAGGKVEGGSVTADAAKIEHAATFVHAAATAYCPDQLTGVN